MNSNELQRAYGDSRTLERPGDGEAVHPYGAEATTKPTHPLDCPEVVETAHRQGWGS